MSLGISRFTRSIAVITLCVFSASAPSQVGLEIDGEIVALPDEITEIKFAPSQLTVNTTFRDIRCISDADQTAGPTTLVIDQVNANESDAEYEIAAADNGGSIKYDVVNLLLDIRTTNAATQQLKCFRKIGKLWGGGFEDVFSSEENTPPSPFPVGNALPIQFTITNETPTTVASDVIVEFAWSADDSTVQTPSPFGDDPLPENILPLGGNRYSWVVDILWPGESRTIDIEYDLPDTVSNGTVITTEIVSVEASNREGNATLTTTGAFPLVSEVITGEASLQTSKSQVGGPDPVTQAGDELAYEVVVRNDGTFALTDVTVIDMFPNGEEDTLSGPTESENPNGILEVDETWTYQVSYRIDQDDIDAAGAIVNRAKVSASASPDSTLGPVTASASTEVQASATPPRVLMSADTDSVTAAGQEITYTLEVVNDGGGQLSLTSVGVSANSPAGDGTGLAFGAPTESGEEDGDLNPGETWTYTAVYTVTEADMQVDTLSTFAVVTTQETGQSNSGTVTVDVGDVGAN